MKYLEVLARGRAKTDARMTETIRAGLFKIATDPETGKAVRTLATIRYEGPAQVKYPSLVVTEGEGASQTVAAQNVVVKIPTGSTILREGDEIDVLASTADQSLVARTYRVDGTPQAGHTTSLRYPVTEQS